MKTRREFLRESKEFWQSNADFELNQSRLSRIIAVAGAAGCAGGLILTAAGYPEIGIPPAIIGGVSAYYGHTKSQQEAQTATELSVKVGERQYALEMLEQTDSNSAQ